MPPEDNENDTGAAFALNLTDNDLLTLLKKPVQDSQAYWDEEKKLKAIRNKNMDLWLPNHWKNKDVYDYQEENLYQENRAFVSVETIVSVVNSRIAQPEVMPAQDTIVSLQVAKDVAKTIESYVEKYQIVDLFRLVTRSLMIKRGGFIKLRWNSAIGKNGDIDNDFIPPEDIIVDRDATMRGVPRFIVHIIRDKTFEELCALLPDSTQKIYQLAGVERTNKKGDLVAYKSQLAKKKTIYEIWFQYFNKDSNQFESGVAVVDENFQQVLDSQRNPNWNYEDEPGYSGNLLDNPEPPFININWLNDGTSYYDQTSMIEQAAPLQNILDRRGFQIMENADQSSSGMVFNTQMITKEDIAKLVGSPDEKVGVKGDVRSAMARISPPLLPNYVVEDMNNLRYAIDNIFGTHDISRGEKSNNKTLGQDNLQREQDYTRMDEIGRAIERMAAKYYRYLLQMMKVYYTEDHYFKAVGEDGQFDFLTINSDLIEDGIDVRVTAGSTQPINKASQQRWVSDLMTAGMIDPLTVYEVAAGGNLPSPRKMLERFMLYNSDPEQFMSNAKDDEFSRAAFMDIQILNREDVPKMRDEYTPAYFKFMNNYMASGDFDKQKPLVKQLYVEYLREAQTVAQRQLDMLSTQMPTQEELDAAAKKDMSNKGMADQIMPQQPQPPMPADNSSDPTKMKADKAIDKQNQPVM